MSGTTAQKRYAKSAKGREARRRYLESEKGKESRRRYVLKKAQLTNS